LPTAVRRIPIGDGVGDACDTCPDLSNPDQKIPVWYKDLDNDGYSDGESLIHCDPPAGYKEFSELTGLNDCDDMDKFVHPGAKEVLNNGVDDDCNPDTPDVQPEYTIEISEITNNGQSVSYDEWLPVDGDILVVDFNVVDVNRNQVPADFGFSPIQVTSHPGRYTNDASEEDCQWEPGLANHT